MTRVSWLAAALLVGTSCDRGAREAPPPRPTLAEPAGAVGARMAGCTLAPVPARRDVAGRLVAIGDLHGDLAATRAALRAAGAIDDADRWAGGDLVVVQTGDILDRGDDESAILELFERLAGEAAAAGGGIVQLLGNHELMNAARDFRYVTPGGMRDFGGDRAGALDPGGLWAKRLARYNTVAIVNGNVLSHAGVTGAWAGRIDEANLAARCWLDGQAGGPREPAAVLVADDSPVWTRAYGRPDADCATLDATLGKLDAKRMIVAHTVQEHGVTSACDGKLWRIDVGLARHYGGPIEVLDLTATPRVVRGER
jgi:hypothetical protein